jgi:hypothetical protein
VDLEGPELTPELAGEEDKQEDNRADTAAIDLVKQLITLAAGVLALSATFLEKIEPLSQGVLFILGAAWLLLIISVFGGIQTLSAIVKSRLNGDNLWSKGKGRNYALTSKYGFLLGIALFALFAFFLLAHRKPKVDAPSACEESRVHQSVCRREDGRA